MRIRQGVIAAAAIGLTFACAGSAFAQTAAELFDQNTIQEIRLSVNSRDLKTLRATTQLNTYYPADLQWKNVKVRNVGIRSRGQGSRNPIKIGLRVDMARYTTGQTLAGLSTIILDNLWQDDALIREKLAFTLFEKMGQSAPRESFCRLFINNEYQGLYTITEEIDGDFAKRVTGETDGTVFEFHYLFPWRAEDLGAISTYKPLFEPRTHVLDADTTLYTPIQQLFKEVNGPDDAVWRQRVEQYIDLNQFMTHVAIETFIADNDALLGAFGMNNFYLYRFQGTTRHRLFVWDKDNAFQFIGSPIPTQATETNVLFRRAMLQPDLRETYLKALEDCATISATDSFLALEVDRLVAIIFDAAKADTRKQFNDRFDDAIQFLRDFAAKRPGQVLADVARIRRTGS